MHFDYQFIAEQTNYGINIHNSWHLANYVELHGKLPDNSLFHFESMNGVIERAYSATIEVGHTSICRLRQNRMWRKWGAVTALNQRLFQATKQRTVITWNFVSRIRSCLCWGFQLCFRYQMIGNILRALICSELHHFALRSVWGGCLKITRFTTIWQTEKLSLLYSFQS